MLHSSDMIPYETMGLDQAGMLPEVVGEYGSGVSGGGDGGDGPGGGSGGWGVEVGSAVSDAL